MTTPYAGYVRLGVTLDSDKLTKSVAKQVIPKLDQLSASAVNVQKNIDAINAKTLEEVADQAGIVAEQNSKVASSINTANTAQRVYNKSLREQRALESELTTLRDRANAQRQSAGRVEADLTQEILDKQIKLDEQVNLTNDRRARAATSQQKADENRLDVLEDIRKAVLKPYEEQLDAIRDNAKVTISEGEKTSKEQIRQARKVASEQAKIERKKIRESRSAQKKAEDKIRESAGSIASVLNLGRIGPIALTGVVVVVEQLLGVVARLAGILGAVPGIFGQWTAGLATIKLATIGVSDAFDSLVSGDLEGFAAGLAKLSPNAQQALLSFQSLLPIFNKLQQAVQDTLFEGFGEQLYRVINEFFPEISDGLKKIAGTMNNYVNLAIGQALTPETSEAINNTISYIVAGFKALEPAIAPLTRAFAKIMEVSSSFLPMLGNIFVVLITKFADFIDRIASSGELQKWIADGIETLLELGVLVGNIGRMFIAMGEHSTTAIGIINGAVKMVTAAVKFLGDNTWVLDTILVLLSLIGARFTWVAGKMLFGALFGKSTGPIAKFFKAVMLGIGGMAKAAGLASMAILGMGTASTRSAAITATSQVAAQGAIARTGAVAATTSLAVAGTGVAAAGAAGAITAAFAPLVAAGGVLTVVAAVVGSIGLAFNGLQDLLNKLPEGFKKIFGLQYNDSFGDVMKQGAYTPIRLFNDLTGRENPEWADPFARNRRRKDDPNYVPEDQKEDKKEEDSPLGDFNFNPYAYLPEEMQVNAIREAFGAKPLAPKDPLEELKLQYPELFAVPDTPALGPDGKPIKPASEAEILESIRNDPQFDPRNFMPPDPYAKINGVKNQPGWPGRPDLNVSVSNMPTGFGAAAYPGAAAMPGVSGALLPAATGGLPYPGDTAILRRVPAGVHEMGAKDLGRGLADCASSVEDLINIIDGIPTNNPTDNLNTGNAATELIRRGFVEVSAPVKGAFNVGVDDNPAPGVAKHMQVTMPDGTNFNWGSDWSAQQRGLANSMGAYDPRFQTTGKIYARAVPGRTAPGTVAAPAMPPGTMPPVTVRPQGLGNYPDAKGGAPVIDMLAAYVKNMFPGLTLNSVLRPNSGTSLHTTGNAADFGIPGNQQPDPQKLALAQWAQRTLGPYLEELIYTDPGFSGGILSGSPSNPAPNSTLGIEHKNHVHIAIRDEMAGMVASILQGNAIPQAMQAAQGPTGAAGTVPTPAMMGVPLSDPSGIAPSLRDDPYDYTGPLVRDPGSGDLGVMRYNSERQLEATEALEASAVELSKATAEVNVQQELIRRGQGSQLALYEAQQAQIQADRDWQEKQRDLDEANRGEFESLPSTDSRSPDYQMDFDALPLGDPRKAMAAFIGGLGGGEQTIAAALGLLGQPVGGAIANVGGAPILPTGTPAADTTDALQLARERNPAFFGAAAGYDIPDYSREGGDPSAQNLQPQTAPPILANGAMTSDTAASIDRTMTNSDAVNQAKLDQLLSVMDQVRTQLTAEVLGPVVEKSIAAGISEISAEALKQIGLAIGEAAGPVVAQAVKEAIGETESQPAADPPPQGRALGGPITGGTPGKDSVPALLMPGEFVLTTAEVQRMGGFAGVERFRAALARGGVQRYASGGIVGGGNNNPGGGQDVSGSVGADFFGVSEIPVLAAAINALVAVLLRVIDVQIIARDSFIELSKDFKDFRGDFKAFDASGRIKNDTSGLVDRTSTSEKAAADERLRILKLVIQGIIKFIIEKIVVPVGKALANAVISGLTQGATDALGTFFPGSDILAGIVSAAVTALTSALIDIIADIFVIASEVFVDVGLSAIGEFLGTLFPGLTATLFSGAMLEGIVGPISAVMVGLIGQITVLFGNFGALFSGLGMIVPLLGSLLAGFEPLTATLAGLVTVFTSIAQALAVLIGGLVSVIAAVFEPIISAFTSLFNGFAPLLAGFSNATISFASIGQVLTGLLNSFTTVLSPALQGFTASVSALSYISQVLTTLLGGFTDLVGMLTGTASVVGASGSVLTSTLDGIGTLVAGLATLAIPSVSVNPANTPAANAAASVDRLVNALTGNSTVSRVTTINAPLTVTGNAVQAAKTIQNRLLSLTR